VRIGSFVDREVGYDERAGEEARREGMESGADDYLVKPFSARELLTRVSAHLLPGATRTYVWR
jgi:DNA-binding response OmpR family regulator